MYISTKKGVVILFIFWFLSLGVVCIFYIIKENKEKIAETAIMQEMEAKKYIQKIIARFPPIKTNIQQGEVRVIEYLSDSNETLFCDEEKVPYIKNSNVISFLISAQYDRIRNVKCTLGKKGIIEADVTAGDFVKIPLNVPRKYHTIPTDTLKRIEKEKAILKEVYLNSNEELISKNFENISFSRRTSPYGEQRIYQNGVVSNHNGLDYGVKRGTPINPIGKGTIVLAQELYFCGNTILIDHGLNIFSLYCHLDALHVKKDDSVQKETIIGTVGSSGLSTGPHLHLSVKVNNQWVNPEGFIREIKGIYTK